MVQTPCKHDHMRFTITKKYKLKKSDLFDVDSPVFYRFQGFL